MAPFVTGVSPRLLWHTEAEEWAGKSAAWQGADPAAVTLFSRAVARMVRRPADKNPGDQWRRPMVEASERWADYRERAAGRARFLTNRA